MADRLSGRPSSVQRWLPAIGIAAAVALAVSVSMSGALPDALKEALRPTPVVKLTVPNRSESLKFAVIGDFGNGEPSEYDIAAQMAAVRAHFPFEIVITTGDNILGRQDDPSDFVQKFERPFGSLLQSGVRFYASLGNHDKMTNNAYAPWNMQGQRYYTYAMRNVRFFVLDTNLFDRPQLAWIEQALRTSQDAWKICYFHHPLYSDAQAHGPALDLRVMLEPLFVKYGVDVVFSGHDHVYERFKPQKDIVYFVAGAGGQLRKSDLRPTAATAAAFDQDRSFVLAEVSGDELFFETLSRVGAMVDSGTIRRRPKP